MEKRINSISLGTFGSTFKICQKPNLGPVSPVEAGLSHALTAGQNTPQEGITIGGMNE